MSGNWTTEQLKAIQSRGRNLLVSAAAGSGKTAVLVERIISLCTDESLCKEGKQPVDIDRLLVVTFTKAAAAEMKGRLREKLTDLLHDDKSTDREIQIYQKQLTLINRANISTFDSLCQRILRENFMSVDIDPSFRVGDELELIQIRDRAIDEVFEQMYASEDESFKQLVECVCESEDDAPLRNIVVKIHEFLQTAKDPEAWLRDMAEAYNAEDLAGCFFTKMAYALAQQEVQAARASLERGIEISKRCSFQKYIDFFENELNCAISVERAECFDEMLERAAQLEFKTLPTIRITNDDGLKEQKDMAKACRDEAKERLQKMTDKYFFKSGDELLSDIKAVYPILVVLSKTVSSFSSAFFSIKKEKRILGFSDIKQLSYKILVENGEYTRAALDYRRHFDCIMVDEYQDTNDVDEGILDALSSNSEGINNRFMVGDVKQSIYRFRQAKPGLFVEKAETYSDGSSDSELIVLHKNFRSRDYILNAINFIFSQVMTKSAAEIEYDELAELVPGARYDEIEDRAVEIAFIETDEAEKSGEINADDEENEEIELKALEVEASYIADKINDLVNVQKIQIKEGDSFRPIKYSDIAILMRSTKRKGLAVLDILAARQIPAFSEGKSGYFELSEISDILSLLQAIDNPLQEIPLLTTLTSIIFNFNADELLEIRRMSEKPYFFDALSDYAVENENELSDKVNGFLEKLMQYRRKSADSPISDLLTYLYEDTNYYVLAGTMDNGKIRQSNLDNLTKRAADFQKTTFENLYHFVRYMEQLKKRDLLGASNTAAQDANLVNIMTIHKSKGLEFPVVFVASCAAKFNLRDLSDKYILHQDLGYGAVYIDYIKRTKSNTLPRSVVSSVLRNESLAEEMRLLYVALTRAKERLYITGSVGKDAKKAAEKWHRKSDREDSAFSNSDILSSTCYFDWIIPSVLRHKSTASFLTDHTLTAKCVKNKYSELCSFNIVNVKRSDFTLFATNDSEKEKPYNKEELSAKIDEMAHIFRNVSIDKFINWDYKYVTEVNTPVKFSISEIKSQYQIMSAGEENYSDYSPLETSEDIKAEFRPPKFMQKKTRLSPIEYGTVVHCILANLVTGKVTNERMLNSLLDDMLKKNMISSDELDSIDVSEIMKFVNSDIGKVIIKSESTRVEVPFVVGISPEEAFLPYADEIILVHGIIDCFFEVDGKITIIDYKTDYAADMDFDKIFEKYKIQLDIYQKAVERITQKEVSQVYLYLVKYGELVGGKHEVYQGF